MCVYIQDIDIDGARYSRGKCRRSVCMYDLMCINENSSLKSIIENIILVHVYVRFFVSH